MERLPAGDLIHNAGQASQQKQGMPELGLRHTMHLVLILLRVGKDGAYTCEVYEDTIQVAGPAYSSKERLFKVVSLCSGDRSTALHRWNLRLVRVVAWAHSSRVPPCMTECLF